MKLIWTEKAANDFAEIVAYIHNDSPQNAELVAKRIYAATGRILANPLLGRTTDVVNLREVVVTGTPYLIFYRVLKDGVRLNKIQRGARQR